MFQLIHFVILISTILLAESTTPVIKDVVRPRSLGVEAYNDRMRSFWTPERLGNAVEFTVVLPANRTGRSGVSNIDNINTEPPISFNGSAPVSNRTTGRAALSSTNIFTRTTGRVFWNVGSSTYSCSASVVPSSTGDLISTAAHCIYDTSSRTWFVNNNWIFVPGYNNRAAPFGIWAARRMIISNAWILSTDYNADVGFVALSRLNGVSIQRAVGSQGIGFNYPRLAFTYAFGYPANINSGLTLQQCSGFAQRSRWTNNNFIGQGLSCRMGGGSSGGPWIQNMGSTGVGFVTSVNSFTINTVPNVMNGPYFSSNTASLYNAGSTM